MNHFGSANSKYRELTVPADPLTCNELLVDVDLIVERIDYSYKIVGSPTESDQLLIVKGELIQSFSFGVDDFDG